MIKQMKFKTIKKYCLICGEKLKLNNTRDIKRKKYCSYSCIYKNIQISNPKVKENLNLGRTSGIRKKAGQTVSLLMKQGLIPKPPKQSIESYKLRGLNHRGEKNGRWISDRSLLKTNRKNCSFRPIINTWIKDILKRDNFTCQITGFQGGILEVHHLNSWKNFKNKRFELDNGITLKKPIHRLFHRLYGNKNITKNKFEEFSERRWEYAYPCAT